MKRDASITVVLLSSYNGTGFVLYPRDRRVHASYALKARKRAQFALEAYVPTADAPEFLASVSPATRNALKRVSGNESVILSIPRAQFERWYFAFNKPEWLL
jgi:hypothetical protein